MGAEDDLERWLRAQPLDARVDVGGESVSLRVTGRGAELGASLLRYPEQEQIDEVLRLGFWGALRFDAGLALSEGDEDLLLTRWLPGVSGWVGARHALEDLLNQLVKWRAKLLQNAPARSSTGASPTRDERHMRDALLRGMARR